MEEGGLPPEQKVAGSNPARRTIPLLWPLSSAIILYAPIHTSGDDNAPGVRSRTQFGQILKRVKKNQERFVVDRRGEPQAVIMGVEDYLKNFAKRPAALAAIQREAKTKRLDQLSLREVNVEIDRYRQERRRAAR